MSSDKKYLKSDESEDESGSDGKSGQIEFHDFIGGQGSLRDDELPFDEQRRLLAIHGGDMEQRVKKQKALREERKALKEGKKQLKDYRQEMQSGMSSDYKAHPVLKDKAQFSGVDRQVNSLPTENIAETNEADRNELENEYRKRYQPEMAPKFHPKPKPQ